MKNNRVFIKIKLKNKMEIKQIGYVDVSDILDQLAKDEHITKVKENVIVRLDNLLYEGFKIESAYLDIENEFVILNLGEKIKY